MVDEMTTRFLELEAMDEFKKMRVSEWHKGGSSLGLNEAQLDLYPLSRSYKSGIHSFFNISEKFEVGGALAHEREAGRPEEEAGRPGP